LVVPVHSERGRSSRRDGGGAPHVLPILSFLPPVRCRPRPGPRQLIAFPAQRNPIPIPSLPPPRDGQLIKARCPRPPPHPAAAVRRPRTASRYRRPILRHRPAHSTAACHHRTPVDPAHGRLVSRAASTWSSLRLMSSPPAHRMQQSLPLHASAACADMRLSVSAYSTPLPLPPPLLPDSPRRARTLQGPAAPPAGRPSPSRRPRGSARGHSVGRQAGRQAGWWCLVPLPCGVTRTAGPNAPLWRGMQ